MYIHYWRYWHVIGRILSHKKKAKRPTLIHGNKKCFFAFLERSKQCLLETPSCELLRFSHRKLFTKSKDFLYAKNIKKIEHRNFTSFYALNLFSFIHYHLTSSSPSSTHHQQNLHLASLLHHS